MTGLEKIIEKIKSDAEIQCKKVDDAAEKKVSEIHAKAGSDGDAFAAEIDADAAKQSEQIIAMAHSKAAQTSRQTVLTAKVMAINATLAKLEQALENMPAAEYFDALVHIAVSNAMEGECEVRLNNADLARLPADFDNKLKKALEAKNAKCRISDVPADIKGGLILVYGDIEMNCSFAAIIEAEADSLKEKIGALIFPKEG